MFRGGTVFATSFVLFSSLRQHGVAASGIQKEMYQYKLLHISVLQDDIRLIMKIEQNLLRDNL